MVDLSEGPTEESLARLRARISARLTAGTSKATLSDEMEIGERTLSAFIANEARTPLPATWSLFRAWYQREQMKVSLSAHSQTSIGHTATLVAKDAGVPHYQLGLLVGQARSVREALEAALQKQDRIIQALESLTADGGRRIDRPEPWLTNREIDEDVAALDAVQQKVAAGKRARPKKQQGGG